MFEGLGAMEAAAAAGSLAVPAPFAAVISALALIRSASLEALSWQRDRPIVPMHKGWTASLSDGLLPIMLPMSDHDRPSPPPTRLAPLRMAVDDDCDGCEDAQAPPPDSKDLGHSDARPHVAKMDADAPAFSSVTKPAAEPRTETMQIEQSKIGCVIGP